VFPQSQGYPLRGIPSTPPWKKSIQISSIRNISCSPPVTREIDYRYYSQCSRHHTSVNRLAFPEYLARLKEGECLRAYQFIPMYSPKKGYCRSRPSPVDNGYRYRLRFTDLSIYQVEWYGTDNARFGHSTFNLVIFLTRFSRPCLWARRFFFSCVFNLSSSPLRYMVYHLQGGSAPLRSAFDSFFGIFSSRIVTQRPWEVGVRDKWH